MTWLHGVHQPARRDRYFRRHVAEAISLLNETAPTAMVATTGLAILCVGVAAYRISPGVMAMLALLLATVAIRIVIWQRLRRASSDRLTFDVLRRQLRTLRGSALSSGIGWAALLGYLHWPGIADPQRLLIFVSLLTVGVIASKAMDLWSVRLVLWPPLVVSSAVAGLVSGWWPLALSYLVLGLFADLSAARSERYLQQRAIALTDAQRNLEVARRSLRLQAKLRQRLRKRTRRLNTILESVKIGLWELEPSTGRMWVDRRWRELSGTDRAGTSGSMTMNVALAHIHVDDRDRWRAMIHRLIDERVPEARTEFRNSNDEPEQSTWLMDMARVRNLDASGQSARIVGLRLNVTERLREKQRSASLQHDLSMLTHHLPGFVFRFVQGDDDLGTFLFASSGIERLYGVGVDEAIRDPESVYSRLHPDDRKALANTMTRSKDAASLVTQYRVAEADGDYRWVEMRASPERRADGTTIWYGYVDDITERKLRDEDMRRLAFTDPVTGLGNRNALLARIAERLAEKPDAGAFSLLMLDLDHFKVINDSFGHPVGDELLRRIAQRLQSLVKDSLTGFALDQDSLLHVVCRLGGDEFVILWEKALTPPELQELGHHVRQSISGLYRVKARAIQVSSSIGIVPLRQQHENAADLLRDADAALYAAKREKRAGVRTYDDSLAAIVERRRRIETDLQDAVNERQFSLVFQPVHRLDTGRPLSVEALIRWMHPQFGPVSPAEFIEIAEDTGQIHAVGTWVIREALRQFARWRNLDASHCPLSVTINVSRHQLYQPDVLLEHLQASMKGEGIDARSVILEITERDAFMSDDEVRAALRRLRDAGVRIAVDDFGVGVSSLSSLHTLPVDIVKIDRSFIDRITLERGPSAVVQAVVTICDDLGLSCIAEGIEHRWQAEALMGFGCQYGQGYLFSRPLAGEFIPRYFGAREQHDEPEQRATG